MVGLWWWRSGQPAVAVGQAAAPLAVGQRAWHLRRLALSLVAARPSRASCSASLSALAESAEDAEPATSPPVPELYERSFSSRGGIYHRGSVGRSQTQRRRRRAADQLPAPRQRIAATGQPRHTLHAIDATHTRWATPTTASSSARTCYLQLALPMRKTRQQRRTPPATCHPDMLHREARRSCSTNIKSL